MKQPILVVMAAGIGSHFGGFKQIEMVGPSNELIIDYSIYDAVQSGFSKVVFIIDTTIENDFKAIIGDRISKIIEVEYVFQELCDLPDNFISPRGRKKLWGTAHAVFAARHLIDAPFAVINADDFYGRDAFVKMYNYLIGIDISSRYWAMIGYPIKNTLTENGHVSRGVCNIDNDNNLYSITERTQIKKINQKIAYNHDNDWTVIDNNAIVSMNFWGLTPVILNEIEEKLKGFLKELDLKDSLNREFYLPFVIDELIRENKATIKVLETNENWYGVTYKNDKQRGISGINKMISGKQYPENLWKQHNDNYLYLKSISNQFNFEGDFVRAIPYGDGHINDTYLVYQANDNRPIKYILQRINHYVFKKPEELMSNIGEVTSYMKDYLMECDDEYKCESLELVKTVSDKFYFIDNQNDYWRSYVFVKDATGYLYAKSNNMIYNAAKAFGNFQKMLSGYPANTLYETIQDFHNTPVRFIAFKKALENDRLDRAKESKNQIEFVLDRESVMDKIITSLEKDEIPLRVTHNDTKLNNVLLDDETGYGKCVIDLDTVMPGSLLYDFGDLVRTSATTALEDEEDLSKVMFSLEKFDSLAFGFLEEVGGGMTTEEIKLFPYAGIIMTLECGIRFLTDHLDGDMYFKVHKPNHNLIRAKSQFKLVEDMENKMEQIIEAVNKYV